jgi:hypothetical protein
MAEKHPCAGDVANDYGVGFHRCTSNGKFEENGAWWCGVHLPSAVAAKRATREAAYQEERATGTAAGEEGAFICDALASVGVPTLELTRSVSAAWSAPVDRITISFETARALIARLGGAK